MLYKLFGFDPPDLSLVISSTFLIFTMFSLSVLTIQRIFTYMRLVVMYKVIALVLSVVFIILCYYIAPPFFSIINGLNPKVVLVSAHPLLLLKVTYDLDLYLFKKLTWQIFVLSTINLGLFVAMMGTSIMYTYKTYISQYILFALPFGNIDVFDQSDLFGDYEGLKLISVLIQSESIFGISHTFVVIEVFFGYYDGFLNTWYHFLILVLRYYIGGILFGILIGKLSVFFISRVFHEVTEILHIVIANVYFTYYMAEFVLNCSATLATFIVSFYIASERGRLSSDTDCMLINIFETAYFIVDNSMYLSIMGLHFYRAQLNFTRDDLMFYIGLYITTLLYRGFCLLIVSIPMKWGFKNLPWQTYIAIFWVSKKGVYQSLTYFLLTHNYVCGSHALQVFPHTYVCFALFLMINGFTSEFVLKLLGIAHSSVERRLVILNCFKHIENSCEEFKDGIKMQRFFTDVDWKVVETYVRLKSPYKSKDLEEGNETLLNTKKSTCMDCNKEIIIEPTKKEIALISRETKKKILNSQKVSFVRQHDRGQVSKDGIRCLLTLYYIAQESPELAMNLKELVNYFHRRTFLQRVLFVLNTYDIEVKYAPPRNRCKYWCHRIVNVKVYEIILYFVSISTCVMSFYYTKDITITWLCTIIGVNIMYTLDVVLKVLSLSDLYWKKGFTLYFRNNWNLADFVVLCINIVWMISAAYILSPWFTKLPKPRSRHLFHARDFALSLQYTSLLRLLKIFSILNEFKDELSTLCDRAIGHRLSIAFEVALALIVSYEEADHSLPNIVEYETVRTEMREFLLSQHTLLTKEVALVHKRMPWVATSVKTKQVIMGTIYYMRERIDTLRLEGKLTQYEHFKMLEGLQRCIKSATAAKLILAMSAEDIVGEVAWLDNYPLMSNFLNVNYVVVNFDVNEQILNEGHQLAGIYIVLEGFIRVTYEAIEDRDYIKSGALPIRENITEGDYQAAGGYYLIPGNVVGELAVMTGRMTMCDAICETPVKVAYIPLDIIVKMQSFITDPIVGLYNRIWTKNALQLAVTILWQTPIYKHMTKEFLTMYLKKAFVPDTRTARVFVSSEMIEDVVLIEGAVKDLITLDVYIAPCYIPRSVHKLYLMRNSTYTAQPVFLVVPIKDQDHATIYSTRLSPSDYQKLSRIIGKSKNKSLIMKDRQGGKINLKGILKNKLHTVETVEVAESNKLSRYMHQKYKEKNISTRSFETMDQSEVDFVGRYNQGTTDYTVVALTPKSSMDIPMSLFAGINTRKRKM